MSKAIFATHRNSLMPSPAVELGNAALIALSKLAEKWSDRDQLVDGEAYTLQGSVAGTINGQPFSMPIDSTLTVGHESTRASSWTPDYVDILAVVLGKLNTATREAVMGEILDDYASDGCLSPKEEYHEMVDAFLSHMRQHKQITQRGAVKVKPQAKECPLAVAAA